MNLSASRGPPDHFTHGARIFSCFICSTALCSSIALCTAHGRGNVPANVHAFALQHVNVSRNLGYLDLHFGEILFLRPQPPANKECDTQDYHQRQR